MTLTFSKRIGAWPWLRPVEQRRQGLLMLPSWKNSSKFLKPNDAPTQRNSRRMVETRMCVVTDQQALLATTTDAVQTLIADKVAELVADGNPRPTVGLVPTMGALHDGHGALFEQARDENDVVIASVFVNPLQFDQPEDFEHYPRDLSADLELICDYGVAIVFSPSTDHVYPGY